MENKIHVWVNEALSEENVAICAIDLQFPEKGEGFNSNITSVSVKAKSRTGKEKVYNFLLKYFIDDDGILAEQKKQTYSIFKIEMLMYNKIFPVFKKFEAEKGVKDSLSYIPQCYKILKDNNTIVFVLEDLKKSGYKLYDKKKALNLNHLKATLREYGKLHALTFALRDQVNEEFDELKNADFLGAAPEAVFREVYSKICKVLEDNEEHELLKKFEMKLRGGYEVYCEIVKAEEPQTVVIHGDCWVGNFMFTYEDNQIETPTHVAFLDWQLSKLASPVFDLSYHLYTNCSSKELEHMEELLKTYYESLSTHLKALGSDPEKLFPYSDFKTHWKKYSSFSITFLTIILNAALCDKEDLIDQDKDFKDKLPVEAVTSMKIKNVSLFNRRVIDVIRHHVEFELK